MENLHRILRFRISLGFKFQLQQTILIFWTKFSPRKVFLVKNGKGEHHNCILHIQISIGTKFQLRLKLLTEIVNITIEFCICELVWVKNFSLD